MKKINLIKLIIFTTFILTSIFSCGRMDYYPAPVYLNIVKTGSVDPEGTETPGPDIVRWYQPGTPAIYYPMVANFTLETISVYEPAIESMKPKGLTLYKILMKYYPENADPSGTPDFTINKYCSLFIPVAEKKEEEAATSSNIKIQQEEEEEEEEEVEGKTFTLIVGDEGTGRLFPNGLDQPPKNNQYYWILKCELYAFDERGNEVKADKYLYLNCYPRLFVEEEE
jgi:hypothetical protein